MILGTAAARTAQSFDAKNLDSLIGWLKGIVQNLDLNAFDGSEKPLSAAAMKDRVGKIHRFLAFRQSISTDAALRSLLDKLGENRRHEPALDPRNVLGDLIAAAEPALDSEEYLPDAAVWLRYVVLLSYQGEGGLILVGQGANSLDNYWQHWTLPQKTFLLEGTKPRARRSSSDGTPGLRRVMPLD